MIQLVVVVPGTLIFWYSSTLSHSIVYYAETSGYRKSSNYSTKKNNSESRLALPLERLKIT